MPCYEVDFILQAGKPSEVLSQMNDTIKFDIHGCNEHAQTHHAVNNYINSCEVGQLLILLRAVYISFSMNFSADHFGLFHLNLYISISSLYILQIFFPGCYLYFFFNFVNGMLYFCNEKLNFYKVKNLSIFFLIASRF